MGTRQCTLLAGSVCGQTPRQLVYVGPASRWVSHLCPTGVLTITPFLMISLPTLIVANHCPKACETWSCNYRFATGKWQQKVMQVTQRHMICQQQHRRRTSTRLTRSLEESFETFRGLGAMIFRDPHWRRRKAKDSKSFLWIFSFQHVPPMVSCSGGHITLLWRAMPRWHDAQVCCQCCFQRIAMGCWAAASA